MRIGLDAKRAYCNYRGLGSYSRNLIEGLVRWGAEDLELFLFTPKVALSEFLKWPEGLKARVEPQGLERWLPELWRGWTQTKRWPSLALDLYHGLSHDLPWGLPIKDTKIKTIVTIHDLIFVRYPELYNPWDRWTYLKKIQYSCHVADSIVAISEQTKMDLVEILKVPAQKISVQYQAVHPRYYRTIDPSRRNPEILNVPALEGGDKPYFLYVGAFENRKNVLRIVDAFARLKDQLNQNLVLVGRGPLEKQLKQKIDQLSLTERIRMITEISTDLLPELYQGATALVYPSLFEGFGLPIGEAMMSDTLVLTSEGGCFPEAAGPGAFYVNPLEVEDIAAKMVLMAQLNPQDRRERVDLNRVHRQKFHWQATSLKLRDHYRLVLEEATN